MTITMKHAMKYSYCNPTLFRAVVRQAGGWDSFKEDATDISNSGAMAGFHGFIGYSETVPFAKRQRKNILSLAMEQARDFGMGVVEMFQGFRCFDSLSRQDIETALIGSKLDSDIETVWYNGLAWYALETAAYDVVSYLETKQVA